MSKANRRNIEMIDERIRKILNLEKQTGLLDELAKKELDDLIGFRQQLTSSNKDEAVGKVTGDQVVRSVVTIGGLVGIIGFEQFGGIITTRALGLISKGLGGGA